MIRSDVDDERIRRIEEFVNELLARQRAHGQRIAVTDALALALFRVTDLLLDEREVHDRGLRDVLGEISALANEIDAMDATVERRIALIENDVS